MRGIYPLALPFVTMASIEEILMTLILNGDENDTSRIGTIAQDRIPVAAYQALYYKLTKRVEKIKDSFDDAYEIKIDDIVQLDNILHQAVNQIRPQGSKSFCTISFREKETIEFSSIQKMRIHNFSRPCNTSAISYSFDFFTIISSEIEGADDIVQRFSIKVKIDQDFVEDDDAIPWIFKGLVSGKNISYEIEYSDHSVARNLQACVNDWVKSLKCRKIPKFILWFDSKSDFFTAFIPQMFAASLLIGQATFGTLALGNTARSIALAIGLAILAVSIGKFFIVNLYRSLTIIRPKTYLLITSGDTDRMNAMIRKTSYHVKFSYFIGGTILAGIFVNIFSNIIWEKFMKSLFF